MKFSRRTTFPVHIGPVTIGADNPVAVQSMTSTSTMDTPGSVAQIERIVDAGGQIVRLTAQGEREARNLELIRAQVREDGYDVPLVADIHFNPKAAFAAASRVEKVRINPGNFVDPGRVFKKIEFTDEEYAEEIKKIERTLVPLLDICKTNSTALRIGVNHGSLSDRIMSRYGDTPAGRVESALEFLRVCMAHDFRDVVVSIKASNVCVMTETVRRMADAMDAEGMPFPLHLGVTEAGDAEDGRIKSAVGIGSLMLQGLGDTIRVSLSEEPECEIPVANEIIAYINSVTECADPVFEGAVAEDFDKYAPTRRPSSWSGKVPQVVGLDIPESALADALTITPADDYAAKLAEMQKDPTRIVVASADGANGILSLYGLMHQLRADKVQNPVIVKRTYADPNPIIPASIDFGLLLLNGFSDGIWLDALHSPHSTLHSSLELSILQATRQRISKTEFISCPSCGRTLYDLQSTLRDIKAATSHLKGLKIGVMGCIVNGPGEMADADYGYVGAGPGRVSLYKGKECIVKNIPTSEAIPRLIDLIKENGDWVDPE